MPLYLVIDPYAVPAALVLYSDPQSAAYQSVTQADAGKALALPDPFGVDLDVKRLLA